MLNHIGYSIVEIPFRAINFLIPGEATLVQFKDILIERVFTRKKAAHCWAAMIL
jgi:hypothetical protein